MRHASRNRVDAPPPRGVRESHVGRTLARLFPYLWQYRGRVVAALSCLVAAKMASVAVPIVFKGMIDELTDASRPLALPILLLLLYGAMRLST